MVRRDPERRRSQRVMRGDVLRRGGWTMSGLADVAGHVKLFAITRVRLRSKPLKSNGQSLQTVGRSASTFSISAIGSPFFARRRASCLQDGFGVGEVFGVGKKELLVFIG